MRRLLFALTALLCLLPASAFPPSAVLLGGKGCTVTQHSFTSGGGTETIPNTGCNFVDIEAWAGGGGGGGSFLNSSPPPVVFDFGTVGGSGGHCLSRYALAGNVGKNLTYTVGTGGAAGVPNTSGGTNGGGGNILVVESSVSNPMSITTMTGGSGGGGPSGINGGSPTVSTPTGCTVSSAPGNVNGTPVTGVHGGPFGAGGPIATAGSNGGVIFNYHN